MSVGSDLVAFLKTSSALTALVGDNVYHARVPARDHTGVPSYPYIWANRRGVHDIKQNTGTRGQLPLGYYYDLDVVSDDIAEAEDIIDAVWAHCQYYAGTFGEGTVSQLYVSDQDESYVSINQDDDSGAFVMSAILEIVL